MLCTAVININILFYKKFLQRNSRIPISAPWFWSIAIVYRSLWTKLKTSGASGTFLFPDRISLHALNICRRTNSCTNSALFDNFQLTGYSVSLCLSVKLCQIFYDLAGNNQSDNRRHKGSRTGNITPLGAFSCCSGRTDTMLTAAYCHVLNRSYGLFFGIDYL